MYAAESSNTHLDSMLEIVLNMRSVGGCKKSDCMEEGDYALIAEWMFLQALKW